MRDNRQAIRPDSRDNDERSAMRDGHANGRATPAGPAAPPEVADAVRRAVEGHADDEGPLMEILHDIQADLGCIPRTAVAEIAAALNLSQADVYGVVTFYNDFREEPAGRRTVRICRAEACQSLGCEALVDHAVRRLGVDFGGTTSDGAVTLDQVFCFGNCALGPTVEVDGRLFGRVSPDRFDEMLAVGHVHG
jgi:formate dehydrogenase subunit gamma